MAAETGAPAIKRLLITLSVIGAVVCGVIYVIVSPPKPVSKPVASDTPSRTLAYQQQIVRPGDAEPEQDADDTQQQAVAPADAAPANSAPAQSATQPKTQAAVPAQPAPQQDTSPNMAALPPGEAAESTDPDALPWQQGGPYPPHSPHQGAPEEAYGPPPGWPEEDGYQQDAETWPGQDADPNAWPSGPEGETQEWVQVLVSGVGMHGMASDTSPMLFAFPYGRTLRVISRYGNWVEVTDPQSATTGWMKAQYLAPVAAPRPRQEMEAWYEDERPRRRRGWFRRHEGEGLGDMIGRALGGAF